MTPLLTIAVCIYILSGLAAVTWLIFGAWLTVVLAFYLALGTATRVAEPGRSWPTTDVPRRRRTEMTLVVGFTPHKGDTLRRSSSAPPSRAPPGRTCAW